MGKRSKADAGDDSFGLSAFRKPAEDTGLSLDRLSAAFAEMLSTGEVPYAADAPDDEEAEAAQDSPAGLAELTRDPAGADDSACEITPRSILEAILFVGGAGQPLTSQQIARLMRGVRPAEIDALVRELNAHYDARRCPYRIAPAGAGYCFSLRPEFSRLRDKFYGKARQARLSQAAIEVLSLVAYNEPLAGEEINRLRGTACGALLTQLVRRQLLAVDRSTGRGARASYRTTSRFLELFGLESLADLPHSDDLDRS